MQYSTDPHMQWHMTQCIVGIPWGVLIYQNYTFSLSFMCSTQVNGAEGNS